MIIGPGKMGLGIALSFALRNAPVRIIDGKERSFDEHKRVERNAKKELYSNLKFLKKVGYLKSDLKKVMSNISLSSQLLLRFQRFWHLQVPQQSLLRYFLPFFHPLY